MRVPAAAALAIAAIACGAASSTERTAAQGRPAPCAVEGVNGPTLCTTVRVKESPHSERAIDLRVVVVQSSSATPAPDPIVPLAGGPGQGAADLAPIMAQRFAAYREQRDLVLIDQRGTGTSNGLWCPPATTATALTGALFDRARLTACRDALAQHADLTQYTTTIAARDYANVFDHLGYKTVNVIGVSYGTRLGLELIRQMPDRIRTLTLDAVAPPDFSWPTTGARDAEAALDALLNDCSRDEACNATFPRMRRDIETAFTRLRREPVRVSIRDPNTGQPESVAFGERDLAYATRGALYGNEALALPGWFRRAAAGDYTPLAQAYVNRARGLEAQIALGVHFGVYCAEDLPFVDWAEAERAADGTRLGRYLLDEYRKGCDVWPRATIDASFRAPVQSNVPTLIMGGRRDPVTPPRTGEAVKRTLSRSAMVTWPAGGHGSDGQRTAECRVRIMRTFLRTANPGSLPLACARDESAVLPFATGR
ncbi:MAG TPA: alpha/beta hydrolase [Vicinamibacterales bacterium]|nr:alpha/beta hydrolase [Vicinamibacterales bacterium]